MKYSYSIKNSQKIIKLDAFFFIIMLCLNNKYILYKTIIILKLLSILSFNKSYLLSKYCIKFMNLVNIIEF